MKRELSNRESMKLMVEANRLQPKSVATREASLKENPNDLISRIELLSYYFWKLHSLPVARSHKKHLRWFLKNAPRNIILRRGPGDLHEYDQKIANLWKKIVIKHPTDLEILENASSYFRCGEEKFCVDLLLKARDLDPQNSHWDSTLSHHYSLKNKKKKSLFYLKSALQKEEKVSSIFLLQIDLAQTAFEAKEFLLAAKAAKFVLKQCPKFKGEWCYGNGIFYGNHVLGLLEMENGNIKKAKSYLSKAGKTPGSPQLNSFGPEFELAQKLLQCGEKAAVISYLKDCQIFWKSREGKIKERIKEIEAGKKVNLKRFSI